MTRLSLRKPSDQTVRRFLEAQATLPLTYSAVGATAASPPSGFVVDHTRIQLGRGEIVFKSAVAALRRWEQFRLGWVEASPADTPLRIDEVVGVMGHAVGLWWLNACRIVSVIDETGADCKFGFAYGTLPGHVECGEERFLIEWNRESDLVWFDILAFSKPNHFLVRLGYFLVRRAQKRFGRESAATMRRAVATSTGNESLRQ